MTDSASQRRRAPGMSPEQRRDMIVRAALPLVAEFGMAVTTAQVARAAGIGEATIFRVFADKDALIDACVAESMDSTHVLSELRSIPLDQPLAARLVEAVDTMRGYLSRMGTVMGALQATGRPLQRPGSPSHRPPPAPTTPAGTTTSGAQSGTLASSELAGTTTSSEPAGTTTLSAQSGTLASSAQSGTLAYSELAGTTTSSEPAGTTTSSQHAGTTASAGSAVLSQPAGPTVPGEHAGAGTEGRHGGRDGRRAAAFAETRAAIVDLLEPDAASLRLPPDRLAGLFMGLAFSMRRMLSTENDDLDPEELVDLFLNGVLTD